MTDGFNGLGLSEPLRKKINTLGFTTPTPIQQQVLPGMLAGKNVVGQAQTGSGKTLAFALPILEHVDPSVPDPQALIIAPTRELVLQICQVFWEVRPDGLEVRVIPVYGGAPRDLQQDSIRQGAHIIVATPGRLIDFLWEGTVKFDRIKIVILDEADRMLEMGFIDDVRFILSCLRHKVQMGLFSATMPGAIHEVIQNYMPDPVYVRLQHLVQDKPKIKQTFFRVHPHEKFSMLFGILKKDRKSTLVFCRTRSGTDRLAEKLAQKGYHVGILHGGKSQRDRDRVVRGFRKGVPLVLLATDIASRGLDIEDIERVINYDVPLEPEDYVHRIGRTARAGKEGMAITLVTRSEEENIRKIERLLKEKIAYASSF